MLHRITRRRQVPAGAPQSPSDEDAPPRRMSLAELFRRIDESLAEF